MQFEKSRHQQIRFLGYMSTKNRYIILRSGMPMSRYSFTTCIPVFFKFEICCLTKNVKISVFIFLGEKNYFFKNLSTDLKKFLFYVLGAFHSRFALNLNSWWFFKHLSVFHKKLHDIGSIKSLQVHIFRKSSKMLC